MCDERSIISGIPQNDESLMNPTVDEAVHALDRSLRQCDNRTAPIHCCIRLLIIRLHHTML
jgi:hypothetical protein